MKLIKKNVVKFIHHNFKIEGLPISSESEIKECMNAKKVADELNLPYLHEQRHIYNQIVAIEYIKENKTRKIKIKHVMKLYEILLKGTGEESLLRCHRVMLGDREPPKPDEVPDMFLKWLSTWNQQCYKSYSKKKHAFLRHCEFMYIHPFPSFNGVLGRLIYLWDCLYHKTQMDIIEDIDWYETELAKYNYELRSRIMQRWGLKGAK